MKLSVVIPARNEEACVAETMRGVLSALQSARIPHEVIVVDDGSTDSTAARVLALAGSNSVTLISNRVRHGFGAAVRAGLKQSTGEAWR